MIRVMKEVHVICNGSNKPWLRNQLLSPLQIGTAVRVRPRFRVRVWLGLRLGLYVRLR
jgi:hypothetical protein